MNLKIINSIVLILLGGFTSAQTNLSANEAVFKALENNYQVQVVELQQEIAEKNNKWSEAGLFPTVTLAVAQNNTIQDNTNNPFTFTPGIILSQSINPSLSANWNLFSGFAVKISKQRLEQLEQQSANNALSVIETTIQDVLKAYYTAQLQQDRLNLFKAIQESSFRKMQYFELKEKYSSSTTLELLQFKNQYLTDSINCLMQKISLENAQRNLKMMMNDTTEAIYSLSDPLTIAIKEFNVEDAESQMFASNSNLRNQYIGLELQQSATSLQRSFLYPTLSFQAGVNPGWSKIREIKDGNVNISTTNLSYYGNFNLRYTLFNNWKNQRAVEVSKIQETIASTRIDEMKQTLQNTLTNLIALYHARTTLVSLSQENISYAKKAMELAEKKFNQGTINSIEYASFVNSYQNSMISYQENLFNKLDTYLEIYKMTGKLGLEYTKN